MKEMACHKIGIMNTFIGLGQSNDVQNMTCDVFLSYSVSNTAEKVIIIWVSTYF
jgi:hypothetical protein